MPIAKSQLYTENLNIKIHIIKFLMCFNETIIRNSLTSDQKERKKAL